jgi:ribosomal-protein-alanine N-acetyltransferase
MAKKVSRKPVPSSKATSANKDAAWQWEPICETVLESVWCIENASFQRPWSLQSFREEIAGKDALSFVILDPSPGRALSAIAYICFRLAAGEMSLLKIAVAPAWRGQGVGRWLLSRALDLAMEKGAALSYLEVRPSNSAAIGLYRKLGFEVAGIRPRYYPETREDALVMIKPLKEEL